MTLTREEVLGRSSGAGAEAGLVWEDVLGMASRNARPIARYLAFMIVAGVVGSYGVIDDNVILIVGAMAISPDLLPITAVGVGLVDRRHPPRRAGARDPPDRDDARRGRGVPVRRRCRTSSG